MNASERSVFYFHAGANPIGGRVTKPVDRYLPAHGSASLAQAGGHAAGQNGPHRIDGILSFENAHSEIFGHKHEANGPWTTTVSSVVEGLNILDIVRADALVTKIKVTHPHGGGPPAVSFGGTHFYNLSVAGKRIEPVFNLDAFSRTEARVKEQKGSWLRDPQHVGAAIEHNDRLVRTKGAPDWVKRRYNWMTDAKKRDEEGHVVCSLVREIPGAEPYPAFGHILHVPDVGNLFLGEITVSHGTFRVTLLRAEMGCQADGDVSAGSGSVGSMMMDSGGNQTLPGSP